MRAIMTCIRLPNTSVTDEVQPEHCLASINIMMIRYKYLSQLKIPTLTHIYQYFNNKLLFNITLSSYSHLDTKIGNSIHDNL
tara:strand:- start:12913 stop:13158 length:246 start_codon:yes stop_codon:yes gene_type:complete